MSAVDQVSIVIPCRDEAASIEQLLDGLRVQDHQIDEVVVVDDGSADGTGEVARQYGERHRELPVRVVPGPGRGIPAALNAGIAAARGSVIIRLDGHSCPARSYVRACVEALQDSGAGVVGGVWEIVPGRPTLTAQAIARAVSHPMGAGNAAYRTGRTAPARREVDTVPFGCFRKALWEEAGGFNERLLTNEDYEFYYRLRMAGHSVMLDPGIRSKYFARTTFGQLARQYFRYGWWKAQMLKAHPKSLRLRQAIPAAFVATFAGLVVASVISPTGQILLAAFSLTYLLALTLASLRISGGRRTWRILALLPAVFATIHFAWGTGVLVNLGTLGSWPRTKG